MLPLQEPRKDCGSLMQTHVIALVHWCKMNKAGKPTYITSNIKPQTIEHVPSADFKASDISNLQVGQKVEHQKFGFGEVIKKEGASHNPIATIKFENNGEKKIMLNYAKFRIIE